MYLSIHSSICSSIQPFISLSKSSSIYNVFCLMHTCHPFLRATCPSVSIFYLSFFLSICLSDLYIQFNNNPSYVCPIFLAFLSILSIPSQTFFAEQIQRRSKASIPSRHC